MTQTVPEGSLKFIFPSTSTVLKFDDCNFHTQKWNSFGGGSKAVDIVVCCPGTTLWLIEVKDYRRDRRTKPSDLFIELAQKVRDSLAGLKVLAWQESSTEDHDKAKQMLASCSSVRIVLHLEQPTRHTKLFPMVIDWKDARDAMKKSLKTVDPRCLVGNTDMLNSRVFWSVQ